MATGIFFSLGADCTSSTQTILLVYLNYYVLLLLLLLQY